MTIADILGIEQLAALGIKVQAVQSCVYSMTKSGVLVKQKTNGTTYYSLPTSNVTPPVVHKPRAQPSAPAIQVDIIKATGRVRLSLNGLVIEIGVE